MAYEEVIEIDYKDVHCLTLRSKRREGLVFKVWIQVSKFRPEDPKQQEKLKKALRAEEDEHKAGDLTEFFLWVVESSEVTLVPCEPRDSNLRVRYIC